MKQIFLACAALLVFATGCQTGQIPDPNSPTAIEINDIDAMEQRLAEGWNDLAIRIARGQIDDTQAHDFLAESAQEIVKRIDLGSIDPSQAWRYGKVYDTARDWAGLEKAYRLAAQHSPNEDRRVNDLLQLGYAEVRLGKIEEGFAHIRETFDTPPPGKGPILYAVLLQIVPALESQGHDVALAKLLEEALEQHRQTQVDPKTDGGKGFLATREIHLGNGWKKVIQLYRDAGREDLAGAAAKRRDAMFFNRRWVSTPGGLFVRSPDTRTTAQRA